METFIDGICSVLFWQNNTKSRASKRANGFEKDHLALKSDGMILRNDFITAFRDLNNEPKFNS